MVSYSNRDYDQTELAITQNNLKTAQDEARKTKQQLEKMTKVLTTELTGIKVSCETASS